MINKKLHNHKTKKRETELSPVISGICRNRYQLGNPIKHTLPRSHLTSIFVDYHTIAKFSDNKEYKPNAFIFTLISLSLSRAYISHALKNCFVIEAAKIILFLKTKKFFRQGFLQKYKKNQKITIPLHVCCLTHRLKHRYAAGLCVHVYRKQQRKD